MNCKVLIAALLLWMNNSSAQKNELLISEVATPNSFPIVSGNAVASFYYYVNDAKVVQIAAKAFVNDVNLISDKQLNINTANIISSQYAIVAGTIGQSKIIDELIREKRIDVSSIKNKWEGFTIKTIKGNPMLKGSTDPLAELGGLLVIAGSDRRGTAFGVFDNVVDPFLNYPENN